MNTPLDMISRSFSSPLLGTLLVLLAVSLLAVPLHRLTASGEKPNREATAETVSLSETTHAILRVRILDALEEIEIRTAEDRVLYRADSMKPGEVEDDVEILLEKNELDLHLRARAGEKETAVFITLLPDGYEECTAYAIGSGTMEETLRFRWQLEHE